ncbi:hypothetical protein NDU88_004289 [Pleurodeles waltl]|uniref:t-SNARE coiled-coil homology domain-containing protein n=1 Tax=Pleurodeles waltl TaxID=8319 RepID=A0AAV7SIC0_PLEWA|nr:hypothetical protein NDU88_004289 [Pleurodeles waltl]
MESPDRCDSSQQDHRKLSQDHIYHAQPNTSGCERKPQKTAQERVTADTPERDMTQGDEPGLRQILAAMQQSLAQIDSKIDSLSLRMDRMTERLDKHAERLDQSERCISDVEDSQLTLSSNQIKMNKTLMTLQMKVDDLEDRSCRNNLRIVCVAASTDIDNMD